MKRFEAQYGVITQHVSQQTLMKAIGQKVFFLIFIICFYNISNQFYRERLWCLVTFVWNWIWNLEGWITICEFVKAFYHQILVIATSEWLISACRLVMGCCLLFWSDATLFPKTRMFVGFDISHAGPQSFADRQMKRPRSEPTVVGVCIVALICSQFSSNHLVLRWLSPSGNQRRFVEAIGCRSLGMLVFQKLPGIIV